MKKLTEILPTVSEVTSTLTEELQIEVCGAIRRDLPMIDVVEIAVLGSAHRAHRILECHDYLEIEHVKTLARKGYIRKVELVINGVPFKLYRAESEYWGAMVLYLTGNRYFNIALRGRARSLFMKLNQYGLWFNGERIGGVTEEQLFDALDVPYVNPNNRSFDVRTELGGMLYVTTEWKDDPDKKEDGD